MIITQSNLYFTPIWSFSKSRKIIENNFIFFQLFFSKGVFYLKMIQKPKSTVAGIHVNFSIYLQQKPLIQAKDFHYLFGEKSCPKGINIIELCCIRSK